MTDRLLISHAALVRAATQAGTANPLERVGAAARGLGVQVERIGEHSLLDAPDAARVLEQVAPGSAEQRALSAATASKSWMASLPTTVAADRLGMPHERLLEMMDARKAPLLVAQRGTAMARLVPLDEFATYVAARDARGGVTALAGATSSARAGMTAGRWAGAGAAVLAGVGALAFALSSRSPDAAPEAATPGAAPDVDASQAREAATPARDTDGPGWSRPAGSEQARIDQRLLTADDAKALETTLADQVAATDEKTPEGKRVRIAQRALGEAAKSVATVDAAGALSPEVAEYAKATAGATPAADRAWDLDFVNWATRDTAAMGYDGEGPADVAGMTTWSSEAKAFLTLEQRAAKVGDVVVLDARGDDGAADTYGIVAGFEGTDLVVVQGNLADDAGATGVHLTRYATDAGQVLGVIDAAGAERLAKPVPPAAPAPAPEVSNGGGKYALGSYAPDQLATWAEPDGPNACGIAAVMAFIRARGGDPDPGAMLELARQYGYSPDAGMASTKMVALMAEHFGIATNRQVPPDFAVVQAQIAAGNPVIVATQGHYWVLEGYNPANDTYLVGPTAKPFGKWDGNPWLTTEQMRTMARDPAGHSWQTMVTFA